jgi:hypothetical protein
LLALVPLVASCSCHIHIPFSDAARYLFLPSYRSPPINSTASAAAAKANGEAAVVLEAKMVAADTKVDAKVDAMKTATDDAVAKLTTLIKTQKDEADAAAATQVEIAASWQFIANPIQPTNKGEISIRVVGLNFHQYDYTPEVAPYFTCKFTLTTDSTKTTETAGQVHRTTYADAEPSYVVICASPTSVKTKTIFQLSLEWAGGKEVVAIPFSGAEKNDLLTFDMTWTSLATNTVNYHVIVEVDGLSLTDKYVCKFTQPDNTNIVKSADGKFLGDKGRQMDCTVIVFCDHIFARSRGCFRIPRLLA